MVGHSFNKYDQDKNGKLEQDEVPLALKDAFKKMGHPLNIQESESKLAF